MTKKKKKEINCCNVNVQVYRVVEYFLMNDLRPSKIQKKKNEKWQYFTNTVQIFTVFEG